MPYEWTRSANPGSQSLRLWPYQSLPARGMAAFVLATFTMITIPLFAVLGSATLWGLLPFAMAAVGGVWFALSRNHKARQIEEQLHLRADTVSLRHRTAAGDVKQWDCNRYWVQVQKYETDGPVPHYITLRGNGREVEIGAFLSEEERIALYGELLSALRRS
ncbi:MAG: DUF2244 domain-containing protein [Sulfitobacter sp.]